MANTDSFIDEVTEEVRRDQLFRTFRRWGWLGAVVIIAIVGGAAYFEYQRSSTEASAQAFGDAILAALDADNPDARIDALAQIETGSPEAEMLLALIAASEASSAEDPGAAAERLRAAALAPDLDPRYTDLALLKAEMIDPSAPSEARQILGSLAAPGAPYEALAAEQLALLDIAEGNLDAGIEALRTLERSAAASPGLQQRASQLIVALESGAGLIDTRPEPEPAEEPATPTQEGEASADPEAEPADDEDVETPVSEPEAAEPPEEADGEEATE